MSHKIEVIDGRVCISVHVGTTPVSDVYRHITAMSPDEVRAFVADVTAAIESLAPVKIDRWLTPADIEKYGDRWEWHSDQWDAKQDHRFTAKDMSRRIVMVSGRAGYVSDMFNNGDYFTPIKETK